MQLLLAQVALAAVVRHGVDQRCSVLVNSTVWFTVSRSASSIRSVLPLEHAVWKFKLRSTCIFVCQSSG